MRSLARDFSSSRRAPPMAASNRHLSSACFSAWVFITSVCTVAPWLTGPMPCARPSGLVQVRSSTPVSWARRSRNAIISRNFQVVSTCSSGTGGGAGWEAFTCRCSSTELALPTEYIITGLRNSAATSRRIWMLSASNRSRWDSISVVGVTARGSSSSGGPRGPWHILVVKTLRDGSKRPENRDAQEYRAADHHRERQAVADVIGEPVSARAIDHQVGLVADRSDEARRRCHHRGDDEGHGIDAQAVGRGNG